jgi:ketosteroid isomerase-like protein
VKADAKTQAEVLKVLNRLAEGYAKRDWNIIRPIFASDPDVVLVGTGKDEKRVGVNEIKIQAERDWAQSESTEMSFGWISVSASGNVAWVASDATVRAKAGGQEVVLTARMTAVLEKRDEKWLIVQAHLSLPAAGQAEGESFPTG